MYNIIQKAEKVLDNCDKITGYRLEIYTKEKDYLIRKEEPEKDTNTNIGAIGFQIPNKNEYE